MRESIRIFAMVGGLIFGAMVTNGAPPHYLDGLAFTGPYALPPVDGKLKTVTIPIPADVEPLPIPAGLLVTCVPGPSELNRSLPRGVIRWTCAVANNGGALRSVSEAMLVHTLLSAGVGVVPSYDIGHHTAEKIRIGPWKRSVRWISELALPLALAAAGDVVDMTATEGRWVAGLAFGLPKVAGLLSERVPNVQVPIWTEAVELSPGNHVSRFMYSGPYTGPLPVQVAIP